MYQALLRHGWTTTTALIGDKNTSSAFQDGELNRRSGLKHPSAFHNRRSHRSSEVEQTGPPLERAISAAGGCKLAPERSEESASSRAAYGRGSRGALLADYQILTQNSPMEIQGAVFVIYLCIKHFCATDGSQLTDPASLSQLYVSALNSQL